MSDVIYLGDQTEWQEKNLEYLRYEYDLKPSDKVIDIGSYRGEWSEGIESKYGCKAERFEALDNRAAWLYDGTVSMGGDYLYTSIYKENGRSVGCEDINKYLKEEIALVKINIEGAEYNLLQHMIDGGIENIKNIQVQFHIIEGHDYEAYYTKITDQLKRTHKLTWRYPFVWENWERC
jgi:hypothetical protein